MDNIKLKQDIVDYVGRVDYIRQENKLRRTVGIGHKVTPKDIEWYHHKNTVVSNQRIEELYEKDINNAVRIGFNIFGKSFLFWPESVARAIVQLIFAVGKDFYKWKDTHYYLKREMWGSAANTISNATWSRKNRKWANYIYFLLRNTD